VLAIHKIDKDKNGSIDYEEFLNWWKNDEKFQKVKKKNEKKINLF
jgi:Ca2+-binding EF-hand superfamily protein